MWLISTCWAAQVVLELGPVPSGCRVEVTTDLALQAECDAPHGRPTWRASPKAVVSEGYDEAMANDWHSAGVTGKGVRVAVIDVGFVGWEELTDSELDTRILTDFSLGNPESSAHGTAVAEVIHDFAPDAELRLYSFDTDVEFVAAVEAAVQDGADVINASIGFDNVWSNDGTSLSSRAVDLAHDAGVIVTVAAGNEAQKYVVTTLSEVSGGLVFDAPTSVNTRQGFVDLRLRWDEPFGAAASDLQVTLSNEDGSPCVTQNDPQDGDDDPLETYLGVCDSEAVLVGVEGPTSAAGLRAWLYSNYGVAEPTEVNSMSMPADARGAIAVGAWEGVLPAWSSRGPTDDDRLKPDVVAATGVSTQSFGDEAFDGTSASAPHVAGVAALWLQRTRNYNDPEAFKAFLSAQATDVGPSGPDTGSGAGELHVDELPDKGCGCRGGNGALMLLGASLLRRKRRAG